MSGFHVPTALAGERAGLITGITWLTDETLDGATFGTPTRGRADSLATVSDALGLDFAFVPSYEPWAAEAARELSDRGVATIWSVAGVLGRAGKRLGWTDMLRMTVSAPGELASLFAEELHEALDEVRAGLAADATAILVADDLAGATGPLVAPDFALDALMPCYKALAGEITAQGTQAIFHSDGDVRILFPALVRAGFSAVHLAGLAALPFAASYAVARSQGLAVLGGVESAQLLRSAGELGRGVGRLALSGGLLVCDDGGITTPEEIAAYATSLEACRMTYAAGSTEDTPDAD